MNAQIRIALAVLAGVSLGFGGLLWLAIASGRLADGSMLIALGAILMTLAALMPILRPSSAPAESCRRAGARQAARPEP
ncbi:MAG: hypothetical protein ACPGJE_04035 [Wenzhouxiangellaceae bacterium]